MNNVSLVEDDDDVAPTPESNDSTPNPNGSNQETYYQMPDYSDDDMEKDIEEMEDDDN